MLWYCIRKCGLYSAFCANNRVIIFSVRLVQPSFGHRLLAVPRYLFRLSFLQVSYAAIWVYIGGKSILNLQWYNLLGILGAICLTRDFPILYAPSMYAHLQGLHGLYQLPK